MVHRELTEDEAELIDSIRVLKAQNTIKRLPRKGEFGKMFVEWTNGIIQVDVNFSARIK
jgi:hypothetical protein